MNLTAKIIKEEEKSLGRIGGNIPECFIENDELKDYFFYITFLHPENRDKYISVFVPKKFDNRIEHNRYPDCDIKLFVHKYSKESDCTAFTSKDLSKSFISEYYEGNCEFLTIKKEPFLIQEEDYYHNTLTEDGYTFFMQIDENFCDSDVICGNYIFAFGILYLYKKCDEIIAGYWQYS